MAARSSPLSFNYIKTSWDHLKNRGSLNTPFFLFHSHVNVKEKLKINFTEVFMLSTILLIVLILLLIGALPSWPHSAKWGYGPSGGLGLILVIIIILVLLGRI